MMKLINSVLAAACFVILASDVLAAARDIELRESFARASDRIDLSQAVSIAEARIDGRAINAKRDAGQWDVTVASRSGQMHVWIDAKSGAVSIGEGRAVR